ncbi:HlyD family type I secretion periplasmic adaptor subunit [Inquilinus limosus]|uniref:HlyD family type I secretion periplasmic adaptor subunit n=1 Tax=Inquilinus limosus TaxID=171674 RepID=UPI003F16A4BA
MRAIPPPPRAEQYVYLPPKAEGANPAVLRASTRGPMLAGIVVTAILIAAFGGWASTAPLASGAVAPGVISPDGSRKTIQHLEGGIISEIMVRDGDVVEVGAPLVILEDTRARAAYEMQLKQYQGLRAAEARLTAERLGRDGIDFPQDLLAASGEAEVREILEVQQQLFATRREALVLRKQVLQQRIRQVRDQIRGLEAQLASSVQRLEIVEDELAGKEILFEKALIPKPQVLAVRRAREEIAGDRGEYQAAIAQSEQKIGETELELVALDAERADEVATEIDRVRGELATLREQLRASEDTLKRTVITAPVSGTVVGLRMKTRGGVIQQGEPILDIVPAEDDLLIDARVTPTDIDVVHPGLLAQVHLSAFRSRNLPQIEGKVRSVSADSLRDEKTGMSYYLARVEVDRESLAELGTDVQLVPGMPAEVLIVTGERTLMGYLLQPLRDVFRRSLRES